MNRAAIFVIGIFGGATLTFLGLLAYGFFDKSVEEVTSIPEIKTNDTVFVKEDEPKIKVKTVVEQVDVVNVDTVMVLTNINQNVDSNEYVVLRDKLLHTQRVKILNQQQKNAPSASDKLIEKMSSDQFYADQITVEFWESPIDYQGYRLNKTKLILFGINPNESFMLSINPSGYLVMQTGDYTTTLEPTERYRSFTFQ